MSQRHAMTPAYKSNTAPAQGSSVGTGYYSAGMLERGSPCVRVRRTCRCARGPVGGGGPGLSSRMPSKRRSGGGRASADVPALPLPRYLQTCT